MDLKKHLDIQKRIDQYKIKKTIPKQVASGNQAFNIAIELVAGMIVG
jgi:F0F1-type ATP synthase assembly protein I